jgi:hypothetical protein
MFKRKKKDNLKIVYLKELDLNIALKLLIDRDRRYYGVVEFVSVEVEMHSKDPDGYETEKYYKFTFKVN